MKKVIKKITKAFACFLAGLFIFLFIAWGGLNIFKFAIYGEYYKLESTLCDNPGLNDGFVCQGICAADEYDKILVSGYMKDHSASRIYVTDLESNSTYVTLNFRGEPFKGHLGGICVYDNVVYIASESQVHQIPLTTILSAKKGEVVEILFSIDVNNQASFAFCDGKFMYVGEFHDGENYICDHPVETDNGTNYAIVTKYPYGNFTVPDIIISLPNKVQGFCITPSGQIVLSTSYGLKSSYYYVYDESELIKTDKTIDGASVYVLGECKNTIKGPAMAEGLDYYDGGVITLTESASNKYLFGKLFFANDIVKLDIK